MNTSEQDHTTNNHQMLSSLKIEPSHVNQALEDDSWVEAMKEELNQFRKNDLWKLVKLPQGKHVVGAK